MIRKVLAGSPPSQHPLAASTFLESLGLTSPKEQFFIGDVPSDKVSE